MISLVIPDRLRPSLIRLLDRGRRSGLLVRLAAGLFLQWRSAYPRAAAAAEFGLTLAAVAGAGLSLDFPLPLPTLLLIAVALTVPALSAWYRALAPGKSPRRTSTRGSGDEQDLHSTLACLHRDRRRLSDKLDELSAMREVSLAVGAILDFDEMIQAVLDLVASHFDTPKALLYVQSTDQDVYEIAGARADGRNVPVSRVLQKRIPVGVGLVGRAALHRTMMTETDRNRGLVAALPLITKDRVVGVLKLTDPQSSSLLPERSRHLHAINGAIAVALENARLYRMAVTDGLTGLYVHRHFQHRLEEEFSRASRSGGPLALLMIDIDHFKKFNDVYGHQTGDLVLSSTAKLLQEEARSTDVVCRYGGEEMSLICPQTELSGALLLARRINDRVRGHAVADPGTGEKLRVTVSIGVSTWKPGMKERRELIERADEALYRAKERGRDRVESLDETPSQESAA